MVAPAVVVIEKGFRRLDTQQIHSDEPGAGDRAATEVRLAAMIAAARLHGVDLDRETLQVQRGEAPQPAELVRWLANAGLWARATRLSWNSLMRMQTSGTVVLLLNDGSAALLAQSDAARGVAWLRDPSASTDQDGVAVDRLRLERVWSGLAILVRPERGGSLDNTPFSIAWVGRLVWLERRVMRDIGIGSLVLSVLTILPPLLVMVILNQVVTYHSYNTLTMVAMIIAAAAAFEAYLGYIRRHLIQIVATRLDAKLNLHVFKRLLHLPIDFFERNQTGAIQYQIGQISKVRDFITGRLLTTLLDLILLLVMLPVLFWLNVPLTWMVLGAAALMALVILVWLPAIRRAYRRWIEAEIHKSTVMIETLHGIRTVKSLALEPAQREAWDLRTAEAGHWRQVMGDTANWPQTLVTPLEAFMNRGVLLIGAYLALAVPGSVTMGSLIAFMMLSGRVASPLASMARLSQDLEEVRAAVGLAAHVLNQAPETLAPGAGIRPRFEGAIRFDDVTFSYPGSKMKALDGVSFYVPAGTKLGIVGRSGSGKSTITRLLQGINRQYEGQIKLDTADAREINLAHLRSSFGVVLQDNFLFRGTIRENIIAGRPGLTVADAMRAARTAGAEEFIERMPQGFETWIEEGSPNLSGGQRQRLAIARALIHDPRILILDEATSALDPESEALVNANIQRIGHGRTMVIVSHRLSSLVECDQILVLDQGKVMDIGTHRELLENCAVYRQLWLQQTRHMDAGRAPRPVLAPGE